MKLPSVQIDGAATRRKTLTMTQNAFDQSKTQLIRIAERVLALASKHGQIRVHDEASLLLSKLEFAQFNLLVLGEFKRGKSTLINALIGDAVFPTGVLPLTSVVTSISYSPTPRASVIFQDGRNVELKLERIEDFVTEKGNPHNSKGVKNVEVEYPSEFLKATGVRIIDTPGVGSVHEHNTRTTFDFLPRADAAIFVFASDQPASRQELDFFKAARLHAMHFFLVQNKIDYLSAADKEASLQFLSDAVEAETGEKVPIYPLSAQYALKNNNGGLDRQDGFAAFSSDLIDFLSKNKGDVLIESSKSKLKSLINVLNQALLLERHAAQMPVVTLERSIVEFQKLAEEIRREQDDAEHIVRGETKRLIARIEGDLKPFVDGIREQMVHATEAAYDKHKRLGKKELIATLREALLEHIELVSDEWKSVEEEDVAKTFALITKRFVDRANEIVDQVEVSTYKLFEFEWKAQFEVEPLTTVSMHSYAVNDPFTLALENIPLILPAPLAKLIIRGRFLDAAKSEISRNSGLLRADFQDRIERSTRDFLRTFRTTIEALLAEVEATLLKAKARQRDEGTAQQETEEQLSSDILQLNEMSSELCKNDHIGGSCRHGE